MTTKVPTSIETLGNLPAVRCTFYKGIKPEVKVETDSRVSYLAFKVNKTANTIRRSIAVAVAKFTPSMVIHGHERGTEFLQSLIDECQDGALKRVAEGKASFELAQDYAKMITDYFDTSRSASGSRITAECLGEFFDMSLAGWLTDKVIAKFPAFDADKVAKVVAQYRAAFSDLAKYQLPHTKPVTMMLQKAWNEAKEDSNVDVDDETAEWISGRIQKLVDRHNADEMLVDAI